jgi:hypothetical protein
MRATRALFKKPKAKSKKKRAKEQRAQKQRADQKRRMLHAVPARSAGTECAHGCALLFRCPLGAALGVPFLWVTFLWASKEK